MISHALLNRLDSKGFQYLSGHILTSIFVKPWMTVNDWNSRYLVSNPHFSNPKFYWFACWNPGGGGGWSETFLFQFSSQFPDSLIIESGSKDRVLYQTFTPVLIHGPADSLTLEPVRERGATDILIRHPPVPGMNNHILQVIQYTMHKINTRCIHHQPCPPDSVSSLLGPTPTCDIIMVIVRWNGRFSKVLLTDRPYCILLSTRI